MFATRRHVLDVRVRPYKEAVVGSSPTAPTLKVHLHKLRSEDLYRPGRLYHPTGREAAISGITIYRTADGKIAEAWSSYDEIGMLEQLGVVVQNDDGDYEDPDPASGFGMIM